MENAMINEVTIRQVHAVIESLDREGTAPQAGGDAGTHFRTVSITVDEGEALRQWVRRENATHTIEIGLAYGFSALYICEGLLLNGHPTSRHVALDPWQTTGYADRGLENLSAARVRGLVEFHCEKSQLALPQFLKAGRQFDLAFVDGNHRFDAVFVDLYYLGHLVRKGGVVILDDYNLPGIRRAVGFYVNNLEWQIVEESPLTDQHQWVVLRTSNAEDSRDFRYFVEF